MTDSGAEPRPPIWQRLAKLGFWFFLIKGLLWLIIPTLALWFGWEATH